MLAKSKSYDYVGKNRESLECIEEALKSVSQIQDPNLISELKFQHSWALMRLGKYEEAIKIASSVVAQEGENPIVVRALTTLGVCKAESDDIEAAEKYFFKAIHLAGKLGDSLGEGIALHGLSTCVHIPRGRFHLGLTTMEQAGYLKAIANYPDWGQPFIKAYVHLLSGQRREARSALDELLPLVEPGTRLAGGYYYLWALLDLEEGELQRAEEYLRLCLRIANQTGAPDLNIWARTGYSRLYRLKNQPAVSLGWIEDALHHAIYFNYRHFQGVSLIEQAQVKWLLGDKTGSESSLEEAIQILAQFQDAYHLALAQLLKAIWQDEQGNPASIETWINAAKYLLTNSFVHLIERERPLTFPFLIKQARSKNPESRKAAEALIENLTGIPPLPLKIYALGQFTVWQGNRRIPDHLWNRRKAGELFRFLLLKPGRAVIRDEVQENLWPESTLETGIGMLHQATSALRRILEPDIPDKFPSRYLHMEGERIRLSLPPGSSIDFEEFETRLSEAIHTKKTAQLEKALSLYIDDLFPMNRYDDWAQDKREGLIELHERGLLALGQTYFEQGEYYRALDCARRILKRNNTNQDAAALGMQACMKLQDGPRAVQLFMEIEKNLRETYDIPPRQDLKRLVRQIKRG